MILKKKISESDELRVGHGENLGSLVSSGNRDDAYRLTSNPNLQSHHIDKLISHKDPGVRRAMASHSALQSHHIDKLVADSDPDVKYAISSHPKLQSHHIDKLIESDTAKIHGIGHILAGHENIKPHHIDKIINKFGNVTPDLVENKNIHPDNVFKIINKSSKTERPFLVGRANLSPHHIDHYIKRGDSNMLAALAGHHLLQPDHIEKIMGRLKPDSNETIATLSQHPKFSSKHVDKIPGTKSVTVSREGGPGEKWNYTKSTHVGDDVFQLNLTSDHHKKVGHKWESKWRVPESEMDDDVDESDNDYSGSTFNPVTPFSVGWVKYTDNGRNNPPTIHEVGDHVGEMKHGSHIKNALYGKRSAKDVILSAFHKHMADKK